MGLIMLGVIFVGVWVHVKCFEMISIDDPSNWLIDIGPSITLWSCFPIILLIFGVSQSP